MSTDTLKIGVLFSQSGSMSVTENAHIQGIILASEEINTNGGINGQLLEAVTLNPAGDDHAYTKLAIELILQHKVNVIFGCCLSTSRKAVVPIIEKLNGVLFYPSVYEGFEYSPNVVYGGAVPNQLVLPLLEYIYSNYGRKIALIGSDTLYAREINRIVKEFLAASDGTIVSETYHTFGVSSKVLENMTKQAVADGADVILSTIVGEDSVTLYDSYYQHSASNRDVPIASLTTTESELAKMKPAARAGHLSISPYFSSLQTEQNTQFRLAFEKKYTDERVPGVYSEVAYALVHMYANAVSVSENTDTETILATLSGAVFKGPGGDVSIDVDTNHFISRPHIGKSTEEGEFDIVWRSPNVIRPDPYLVSYDRSIQDCSDE